VVAVHGAGCSHESGGPGAAVRAPTPLELRELHVAVAAHLLHQGLRLTALTLEEEAGVPLAPLATERGAGRRLWEWRVAAAHAKEVGSKGQ
jgi:hypothetical protein